MSTSEGSTRCNIIGVSRQNALHKEAQLIDGLQERNLTWVSDAHGANSVVFTARCAELDVVSTIVMNSSLGQHGIVFNLAFPKTQASVNTFGLSKASHHLCFRSDDSL